MLEKFGEFSPEIQFKMPFFLTSYTINMHGQGFTTQFFTAQFRLPTCLAENVLVQLLQK